MHLVRKFASGDQRDKIGMGFDIDCMLSLDVLQERKGKHYLDSERRRRHDKAHIQRRRELRTPTLSPSPEARSPSPECEELKRLKMLKEIHELVVRNDEMFVAEPADPRNFEYDERWVP